MKTINIKTIRIDGGTQSRVEINNEIVTEYAEAIKAGAEFPAVVVFNDGADNWLADGFHRFHGHNQAGLTSISAEVRQGTVRDAKLFSFGANGKHGQRPTQADRRKAIDAMLNDPEWVLWSNSAIAKTCDVSDKTVAARRNSIFGNSEDAKPATRTVERNGKTYEQNTSNIGQAPRKSWDGVDRTPTPPTPKEYPVNLPDECAPDAAELSSVAAAEKAEAEAMRLLLASDAPLADITEKYKQALIQISMLEARIVGMQNESSAQISQIKSKNKQIEKLTKKLESLGATT